MPALVRPHRPRLSSPQSSCSDSALCSGRGRGFRWAWLRLLGRLKKLLEFHVGLLSDGAAREIRLYMGKTRQTFHAVPPSDHGLTSVL